MLVTQSVTKFAHGEEDEAMAYIIGWGSTPADMSCPAFLGEVRQREQTRRVVGE